MLRRTRIDDERRRTVHVNRYAILAREARILRARALLRLAVECRLATLTAFIIERQAVLTDLAVEMFDKLVGSARRTAERRHEENLLAQAEVLAAVAQDHVALGRALLEARRAGSGLSDAVERALGWERLAASVKVAEDAASSRAEGDGIEEVAEGLEQAAAVPLHSCRSGELDCVEQALSSDRRAGPSVARLVAPSSAGSHSCSQSYPQSSGSLPIAKDVQPEGRIRCGQRETLPAEETGSSLACSSLHPLKDCNLRQTRRGSDWRLQPYRVWWPWKIRANASAHARAGHSIGVGE